MSLKIESDPITIKRSALIQLMQQFRNLGKYHGEKFAAFFSKNQHRMESKVNGFQKKIEEMRPQDDSVKAYAEAEEKIFSEYAKKDKTGKPMMRGQFTYDIDENRREEFDQALKDLRESDEHKETWKRIDDFNKEREEYLNAETDYDPHRIYEENLPADITGQDRYLIEDFIVERDKD